MLTRRRFIAISAALAPSIALSGVPDLHVETGFAIGAAVTIRLQHSDAPHLAALAMSEIRRLEAIFSLYQPGSALSRLNRDAVLTYPPFELLDCLTIANAVHRASGGRFDPTVQPLWRAEAAATERGLLLTAAERADASARIGWWRVNLASEAITLRPGMALTLNGIAQGYIADCVAALLARHGLTRALVDTGELRALPDGTWPVELATGGHVNLTNRALATSAPLGMTFGGDGKTSHILNPATGLPAALRWSGITVSATTAALADALSTAACLTDSIAEAAEICDAFPGATLDRAIPL